MLSELSASSFKASSVFFSSQCLFEEVDGLLETELLGPGLEGAVARYLVVLDRLRRSAGVILVPEEDRDVNPAGVKGIGELANVGTAAAVANAVHHATGTPVRALPIRLEKLLT